MKAQLQPKIESIDVLRYKKISQYCIGHTLDIACGLKGLAQYVPAYIGCDLNGGDVIASAYQLPFANNHFDTVVLAEVLEHLTEPLSALQEAARVSRQRIVLTVPNDYSLVRLSRVILGRYADIEEEHILSYNDWNIKKLLEKVGFELQIRFAYPLRLQYFPTLNIQSKFGYWLFAIADKKM